MAQENPQERQEAKQEASEGEIPSRNSVSDLLRACVEKVLLPHFHTLSADQIHRKGADSVVTEADFEAERFLDEGLRDILPNSIVLGEEGIANDKNRLKNFLQTRNKRPVWLVDPIDGTRNFVKRSPVFCSMIALVYNQRPCASWIYAHSDNCIMHARLGEGAEKIGGEVGGEGAGEGGGEVGGEVGGEGAGDGGSVFVDDTPLAALPPPPSSTASSSAASPPCTLPRGRISWTKQPLPYDERLIERIPSVRCAGQDFVDLARGRTDFSYYNSLWPWDHAAGGFLLESAGGKLAEIKTGATPSPFVRTSALLATKQGIDWQALQKIFEGRTKEET